MIISQTVADGTTIIIARAEEVAYWSSIGLFPFDLGPLLKVKLMHISTVKISQTVTDRTKYCYCQYIGRRLLDFDWYMFIFDLVLFKQVKVIRNSIAKKIEN